MPLDPPICYLFLQKTSEFIPFGSFILHVIYCLNNIDREWMAGVSFKEKMLQVSIWRGEIRSGYFQTFEVPTRASQTVLDVVAFVQQNLDPTLSYRFACRVGMCGSCAMTVNGQPRWTCRTHVGKIIQGNEIRIAPLRNLPVVKDLVTDMDPFFAKWIAAEGAFHPTRTRNDPVQRIDPQTPRRKRADEGIECINCAVCYAACDTVSANPSYLGPAALNRAWTLINDDKDGARPAILSAVSAGDGCHNCHSQGSCTVFCPNELTPLASIAGLKRATVKACFTNGTKS